MAPPGDQVIGEIAEMKQTYRDMIGKFQYFNQIEICKSILMQNQETQFTFKLKQNPFLSF